MLFVAKGEIDRDPFELRGCAAAYLEGACDTWLYKPGMSLFQAVAFIRHSSLPNRHYTPTLQVLSMVNAFASSEDAVLRLV